MHSNITLTRLLSFHIPDTHKPGNLAPDATPIYAWRRWCGLVALFAALGGATLFFLEARIIAGDALGMLKIQTEAGLVSVGHAFRQI